MANALVVEKYGMTRVFTEDGASIPVTVLRVALTKVTQVKTVENDGYMAIQVTTGEKKPSRLKKPALGHFKKANVQPGKGLWEFRIDSADELASYSIGDELKMQDIFSVGQFVDVTSVSKGKGFAGVIKRHNFAMQDATHGNSLSHRAPGSIGQNQTPGRVFKNKKMAGHMGDAKCTVQNQEVIRVDSDKGLILVRGGVPGAPGAVAIIRHSVKRAGNK
jgi:large subunit ribosomal protein L3